LALKASLGITLGITLRWSMA